MNPTGKIVWITGASSGIGEALALQMATLDTKLILSARSEDKLREVKNRCEEIGAKAHILPLDLADLSSLPSKADTAWALFDGIDILVNNGGVSQRALALETYLDIDRRMMDINYFGAIALTKAILPKMIERGGGQLVTTSSVLGKYGVQNRTAYAASKHALHGFFDALRSEMAISENPIKITLICPGWVRTNVSVNALKGDGTPHGIMDAGQNQGMSSEKCAKKMLEAIAKNKSEVAIGGAEAHIAILIKRLVPNLLNRLLPRIKIV